MSGASLPLEEGGSLTAANYTQSFGYDNLGRLTSGPRGSYSYGNSAHLHAATAIGSAYSAAYDPAGDMTCRAPSSSATCAGTQTGAQLTYDSEGSLSAWQNPPSNPTSTAGFLYDNQGNRVEQQVTQSGTTTTTIYVGNLEQVVTTGSTTTTTTFYYAGSARIALAVNGTFSYLASDGLASATVALNAGGTATASTLYAPYGGARYSSGTMPTDYGFTGQHADSATGLDYYNARYYDPLACQFTSADRILSGGAYDVFGLSRYAYVEANPVIRTDPSGNTTCSAMLGCSSGGAQNPGQTSGATSTSLITNHSCTGRCQIIMQLFEDSNPSGSPLKQWYEQFVVPDMWILTCLGSDAAVCGGSGLPEGNVLSWAEQGPGDLAMVNRTWTSERAALYQEEKTNLPRDVEYRVSGVYFDGVGPGGLLVETKGPGYANFVGRDGKFQDWFIGSDGGQGMLKQAGNQIKAAPQGAPIVWLVAEERAQQAIIKLLSSNGYEGINVIYSPPGVNPWP